MGSLNSCTLGSDHWYVVPCPGPWVRGSVTTNSVLDPSTTFTLSSWFYWVYLIWCYYLSVKFVVWIVKQNIENIRCFFLKKTNTNWKTEPTWLLLLCLWPLPGLWRRRRRPRKWNTTNGKVEETSAIWMTLLTPFFSSVRKSWK